jgi:hypothetical protein
METRINVPKEIAEQIFISQEDSMLVLDPEMVLFEFFGEKDFKGQDFWSIVRAYNNFLFTQKVSPLKNHVQHLKESNDFYLSEIQYLKWINAECITILKNKGVDTYAIIKDYKKKRQEEDNKRKHMEEQRIKTTLGNIT